MSENQRTNGSMKDVYYKLFGYDGKSTPFGASLDELLKSCPYTDSAPTKFSVCFSSLKEISLFTLYSCFINFSNKHAQIEPIQECIFPLFCHIVMHFRINEETDRLQSFVEENLKTVPQKFREEVDNFLLFDQAETYHRLSCLFSTQLYIIKMIMPDYNLLNDFLNEPQNFQLKRYLADIITIEIIVEEVKDTYPINAYPLRNSTSGLSVLNLQMRDASFASIVSDLSSVYITIDDTNVCKVDTRLRSSESLYLHPTVVTSMSVSSQSSLLLTTDVSGFAYLYGCGTKELKRINCRSQIWCSCFAPQGGVFAVGTHDPLIRLYDARNQRNIRAMVGHSEAVKTVEFHPNCSMVGSLSADASFRIWDVRQAETCRIFIGRPLKNSALAFAPNGKWAAFFDGDLEVCDIGSGDFIIYRKQMPDVKNIAFSCFSEDSRFLYTVCSNGRILAVDMEENHNVDEICDLDANIISCRFIKSGELVVATMDKQSELTESDLK